MDSSSQAAAASDAAAASSGMAGNLVSAIRSFLPGGKPPEPQLAGGKKPVKVAQIATPAHWYKSFCLEFVVTKPKQVLTVLPRYYQIARCVL